MSGGGATVLVTGAAGFIGRQVAKHFAASGWTVAGVDADAAHGMGSPQRHHVLRLPAPEFGDLVRRLRPAVLVHCAGRALVDLSRSQPKDDFHFRTRLARRGQGPLLWRLLED